MQHITAPGSLVHFSLAEAQLRRLTSWFPEIVVKCRPGAPIYHNGDEIRVGNKGSLALYRDGGWCDFEAECSGFGALTWITNELAEQGVVAVRRFALGWLTDHPGPGSFEPDAISEAFARVRAERHAAWAREILDKMQSVEGTDSETNLISRGLPGPYPEGLLGHMPDARMGESGLVARLTNEAGVTLGVQVGYIAFGGAKSIPQPQRHQFWLTLDLEERKTGLFRIPADPQADNALPGVTLLCEGVEKATALHMAFPGVPVLGVPGIGRLAKIPPIKGTVLIVRDGNEPGSSADKSLRRGIDHLLLTDTTTVRATETPIGMDADLIVLTSGVDALCQLILAAPEVQLSAEGEAQRLAAIHNVFEFDAARDKVAKRLGINKSTLDKAVKAQRRTAEASSDSELEEELLVLGPKPWSEPVEDIAAVLTAASNETGNLVIAAPAVRDTMCLYSLSTHFLHHWNIKFRVIGRLGIQAAAPQCGKTTLLEAMTLLVARPMTASSLTPATVYRAIDKYRPTLLLDEVDAQLRSGRCPELVAILKASHNKRFAAVPRSVPLPDGGWDLRLFASFCTYAYTTIGRLKDDALESRAITVTLQRAKPAELKNLTPFVDGESPVLSECGRKFARWAQDQTELPEVVMPEGIAYRDQDNWRLLLRIAKAAGAEWLARAERAALEVNGTTKAIGTVVPLLTDSRAALGTRERVTYDELVSAILALPEPSWDWSAAYRGGPINAYYLRENLRGVIDAPANERRWRQGGTKVRGYLRKHFEDAFARYLPDEGLDEDNYNEQPGTGETERGGPLPREAGPAVPPGPSSKTSTETTGYPGPGKPNEVGPGDTRPAQQLPQATRGPVEFPLGQLNKPPTGPHNDNDINVVSTSGPGGPGGPGPLRSNPPRAQEEPAHLQPEIEQPKPAPDGKDNKTWLPKGDRAAPSKEM